MDVISNRVPKKHSDDYELDPARKFKCEPEICPVLPVFVDGFGFKGRHLGCTNGFRNTVRKALIDSSPNSHYRSDEHLMLVSEAENSTHVA